MRRLLALSAAALGLWLSVPGEAAAQGLVPCAREGEFCQVPYPTRVLFGAGGSTSSRFVSGRGIPCGVPAFGDPAYGVRKRCWYVAEGGGRGGRGGYRDDDDDDRFERRRERRRDYDGPRERYDPRPYGRF